MAVFESNGIIKESDRAEFTIVIILLTTQDQQQRRSIRNFCGNVFFGDQTLKLKNFNIYLPFF